MTTIQVRIPNWMDWIFAWPVVVYRKWKYTYSFRRIYLEEGEWTIVECKDYYWLNNFKWHLGGNGQKFYAYRNIKVGPGRTKMISMHRAIMNAPDGRLVDHRNRIPLDNRASNLRLATPSQNGINRGRDKSKTSSRFRGVTLTKGTGKWNARIVNEKKRIWLGDFSDEIEAAKAYDAAAKKYHGEFARLNFPEGAPMS